MTQWKLIVLGGPDSGLEFRINSNVTVGRSSECNITIGDPSLSRQHFQVEVSDTQLMITDLDSSNGTFVDGRSIRKCSFDPGFIITAGSSEFTFTEYCPEASLCSLKSDYTTMITGGDAIGQLFTNTKEHRDLVVLYRTARRLPLCTSLKGLGEALLSPLCSSLGADFGAVFLIHTNGKLTEGASWAPSVSEAPSSRLHRVSAQLLKKTIETQTGCLEHYKDGSTVIAVPLTAYGKTRGVLYSARLSPDIRQQEHRKHVTSPATPWDDRELCIATAMGEIGGPALANLLTRIKLISEKGRFHSIIRESTGIVGESQPIREVTKMISKLAASQTPVLILGETGTGKELAAKAIHFSSTSAGNPMISVNCAALTEGTAESELFGHVKGAFTGATRTRRGRFEQAEGGTLFLDELGELSLEIQAKLLRVIETSIFTPVGANREKKANVRIIAATNRNLKKMVSQGLFRKDLYFRLNAFPLVLPPLRHRRDDIPLLARHFIKVSATSSGFSRLPEIPEDVLTLLTEYHWPGNIRELSNVIERCIVLADNETISVNDLPASIRMPKHNNVTGALTTYENMASDESDDFTIEKMEAMHIRRVLEITGGNKKKAAAMLGIERATLYKKIAKYGLANKNAR